MRRDHAKYLTVRSMMSRKLHAVKTTDQHSNDKRRSRASTPGHSLDALNNSFAQSTGFLLNSALPSQHVKFSYRRKYGNLRNGLSEADLWKVIKYLQVVLKDHVSRGLYIVMPTHHNSFVRQRLPTGKPVAP